MALLASPAFAATLEQDFTLSLTITEECTITDAADIVFAGQTIFATGSADLSQTTSVNVQCTAGTDYTIGLNGGVSPGTIAARTLKSDGNTIAYNLYKEGAHTNIWGNDGTAPNTWVSVPSATGGVVTHTIYALVPAPATAPPAGTYVDTIHLTLTY